MHIVLDGCRLRDELVDLLAALRVDEVRGKERVDEGRLAEAGLACRGRAGGWAESGCARTPWQPSQVGRTDDDDVELKAALEELVLDLPGDGWMGRRGSAIMPTLHSLANGQLASRGSSACSVGLTVEANVLALLDLGGRVVDGDGHAGRSPELLIQDECSGG